MSRALRAVAALLLSACMSGDDGPCHVVGCSSHVCADRVDVGTTCEWLPEYACYRTATCEPQADGACGWTRTAELAACIEAARGE